MHLEWTLDRTDDVTLVRLTLHNDAGLARRVRLRNRLDGPVLPPRRQGTPETGWDRNGVSVVVPAGDSVALGYACPADPDEPPATIESVTGVDGDTESRPDADVDHAIRTLGDHRPPRAVLGDDTSPSPAPEQESGTESNLDPNLDPTPTPELPPPTASAPGESRGASSPDSAVPPEVASWLAAVRERVETVESLEGSSVEAATAVLEANGGVAGVASLSDELGDDEAALRAVAEAASGLADRAAAADPPTGALRRLT